MTFAETPRRETLFPRLRKRKRLRPLSVEDGNNGYWDAKRMGNGRGQSFVIEDGVKRFVTDAELARIIDEDVGDHEFR